MEGNGGIVMGLCLRCGAVGAAGDLNKHVCNPPAKGTVKNADGTVSVV